MKRTEDAFLQEVLQRSGTRIGQRNKRKKTAMRLLPALAVVLAAGVYLTATGRLDVREETSEPEPAAPNQSIQAQVEANHDSLQNYGADMDGLAGATPTDAAPDGADNEIYAEILTADGNVFAADGNAAQVLGAFLSALPLQDQPPQVIYNMIDGEKASATQAADSCTITVIAGNTARAYNYDGASILTADDGATTVLQNEDAEMLRNLLFAIIAE
ncbi:MAG: hypothetical protein IJ766_03145 [Clostridia bacterium]|nr:hypothetical protein [Clostridia bacterium]